MNTPSDIARVGSGHKGRNELLANGRWILVVALLCGGFAFVVFPLQNLYLHSSCAQQLKKLAKDVHAQLDDNLTAVCTGQQYPRVIHHIALQGKRFQCPSSGGPYEFWLLHDANNGGRNKSLVALESLKNHRDGANVLFEDGHVEFVNRKRYRDLLKQWRRHVICVWETSQVAP